MKRSVLVGILAIVVLSTADLIAQRNDRNSNRNDRKGGKEVRKKKGKLESGNRYVRVVDRRTVSYAGLYGSSYKGYNTNLYRYANNRKSYRPSNRHIWIEGEWRYNRRLRRDVWYDGYWIAKKRNHKWVQGHNRSSNGARAWVAGRWIII